MKRFCKINAILKRKQGETLMEGIVSIMLFTILTITVTMTILVSLQITGRATRDAGLDQVAVNNLLEGNDVIPVSGSITFTASSTSLSAALPPISIRITEDRGFTAFAPAP
ncbi:MAG: hypothetical protein FWG31_05680 [Oscillospiraceae bacterium]|nr:hypothetical protein [Oscillospiraceae bacterium]